jgi:hypothetical protein
LRSGGWLGSARKETEAELSATRHRLRRPSTFGLDSLIEIGASTVVIWELSGTGQARQQRALRLIGVAFGLLAAYLAVQSTVVLVAGYHPRHSPAGSGGPRSPRW